jgi:hypothetical protein
MTAALAEEELRPIDVLPNTKPGFLRLAVLCLGARARSAPTLGIVRPYPITLAEHPATHEVLIDDTPLPGACYLRDHLLTVPTHSRVHPHDILRIAGWLSTAHDAKHAARPVAVVPSDAR